LIRRVEISFWTNIKQLNETENTTIFLTTHYLNRVAPQIAIVDHLELITEGTKQPESANEHAVH